MTDSRWDHAFECRDVRKARLAEWAYGFTLSPADDQLSEFINWCESNLTDFDYISLGAITMIGIQDETEAFNFRIRWSGSMSAK